MSGEALRYNTEIDLNDPNTSHAQLVRLAGGNKRVLEVGPATGYVSKLLHRNGCRIVGLEIDAESAKAAAEFCERIIVGDIERIDLDTALGPDRFEVIMFGDVLEHLIDPWRVLRQVRPFLAPDGKIVASVPNVAHASVRLSLLAGRFQYNETGLLDRTHLRFFTRSSVESLFTNTGYEIETWCRTQLDPLGGIDSPAGDLFPLYFVDALRNDEDAMAYQYVVAARKAGNRLDDAGGTQSGVFVETPPPQVLEEMRRRDQRMEALNAAIGDAQRELANHQLLLHQVSVERDQIGAAHDQAVRQRDQVMAERDQVMAERDQVMAERDQVVVERDQVVAERDQVVVERDQVVAERDQVVAERDQAMADRDWAAAERLKAERALQRVSQTPGYQALEAFRQIVQRVAPAGGLRWRAILLLSRGLSFLAVAGPFEFARRAFQPWLWGKPIRAPSRAFSGASFTCALDPSLPAEMAIGAGTALLIRAWCINPGRQLKKVALVLDDIEVRTSVRRGVPALGFVGEPQTMPGMVVWTMADIGPSVEERDLDIALRLTWRDGRNDLVSLGKVRLLPRMRVCGSRPPPPNRVDPNQPLICVCMTTYNPPLELFKRQIYSIRAQTQKNWLCIIRDDGSDEAAFAAIKKEVGLDQRFHLYRNTEHLGFYRNSEACLGLVPNEVEFVALSDHDDAWYPDKLEALLAGFDDETLLVYSDMNIVDSEGTLISPTYWTTRRNNSSNLTSLMIANTITGAASMFRRRLLDLALPFPQPTDHSFHDNWLGCMALSLGKVGYIDRPLYDYVQHQGNVIGHYAPQQRGVVGDLVGGLQRLIRDRSAGFLVYQGAYFYDVLRVQLVARTLLARLKQFGRQAPAWNNRRALERVSQLDDRTTSFWWLLLRGAPSLGRTSVTLSLEYNLARGLLWRTFSRLGTWRQRGIAVDPLVATPAVRIETGPSSLEASNAIARTEEVVQGPGLLRDADTAPVSPTEAETLEEVRFIGRKTEPLRLRVAPNEPQRVNILVATIDPKYFFGGYISMLNLARKLSEQGERVRVVILEPCDYAPERWRSWLREFSGLDRIIEQVEFSYQYPRSRRFLVSSSDVFVATSWWTAHVAHAAAKAAGKKGFVFMVQEYEPVFYPMGSMAALAAQAYDFPQYDLFSTELLQTYFREQRVGVFKRGGDFGQAHSVAFRNAITPITSPTLEELAARPNRRLLFYARPESHASRNMFELGMIALARAIEEGYLPPRWEAFGIGTLGGDRPIEIAPGRRLQLLNRKSQSEYGQLLRSFDVGLSLMHSPHPSLVPMEMAKAGMMVVTNTFANKDEESLAAISSNLIGAEPTPEGISDAIRIAVARAEDFPARVAGSHVSWPSDWDAALNEGVMRRLEEFLNFLR